MYCMQAGYPDAVEASAADVAVDGRKGGMLMLQEDSRWLKKNGII